MKSKKLFSIILHCVSILYCSNLKHYLKEIASICALQTHTIKTLTLPNTLTKKNFRKNYKTFLTTNLKHCPVTEEDFIKMAWLVVSGDSNFVLEELLLLSKKDTKQLWCFLPRELDIKLSQHCSNHSTLDKCTWCISLSGFEVTHRPITWSHTFNKSKLTAYLQSSCNVAEKLKVFIHADMYLQTWVCQAIFLLKCLMQYSFNFVNLLGAL